MPKTAKTTIKTNPLEKIISSAVPKKTTAVPKKITTKSSVSKITNLTKNTLNDQTLSDQNKQQLENHVAPIEDTVLSADQIFKSELVVVEPVVHLTDPLSGDYRRRLANTTILNSSQWAAAAGFIAIPGVNTITISGVQLRMLYSLCKIYKVPFKKEAVLAVVGAALGGSITTSVAFSTTSFGLSKIPYVGSVFSLVTQPILSYATTYALGALFIKHFENNGNLLNFKLDSTQAIFDEQFEKAKSIYKDQLNSAKKVYFDQVNKAKSMFSKSLKKTANA